MFPKMQNRVIINVQIQRLFGSFYDSHSRTCFPDYLQCHTSILIPGITDGVIQPPQGKNCKFCWVSQKTQAQLAAPYVVAFPSDRQYVCLLSLVFPFWSSSIPPNPEGLMSSLPATSHKSAHPMTQVHWHNSLLIQDTKYIKSYASVPHGWHESQHYVVWMQSATLERANFELVHWCDPQREYKNNLRAYLLWRRWIIVQSSTNKHIYMEEHCCYSKMSRWMKNFLRTD